MPDKIIEWFGIEKLNQHLERAGDFWSGSGRAIASVYPQEFDYRQIFDTQQMLSQAEKHIKAQAKMPGLTLPNFWADFGTVSTAKYWGGEVKKPDGGAIFITPAAKTLDKALELTHLPVDDPTMDGAAAVRLFRQLSEKLGTEKLWLKSPDMQGVLNTAGLIVDQQELFMDMIAAPEKVHLFLQRICDFLIEWMLWLRAQCDGRISGNIWPYTFLPADVGVSFTEDMMPLLSRELYKEFGIPYLRQMQDALGSLHIHCCGQWGHHVQTLTEAELDIAAMEFHYPYTRIEELEAIRDNVVLVPYLSVTQTGFAGMAEYWDWLLANTPSTVRYWFAAVESSPEMIDFAARIDQ